MRTAHAPAGAIGAERAFGGGTRRELSFETGKATDTVRTRNRSSGGAQRLSVPALSALIAPVPAIRRKTREEHLADRCRPRRRKAPAFEHRILAPEARTQRGT